MPRQERDNTNRFTLGRNRRKTQEKQPDFNGKLNIDGVEYWLSAWIKTNPNDNSQFFSGTVRPVDETEARPAVIKPAAKPVVLPEDDIPF